MSRRYVFLPPPCERTHIATMPRQSSSDSTVVALSTMRARRHTFRILPSLVIIGTQMKVPSHADKRHLLCGPYAPPATRVGRTVKCLFNGKVTVCGWSDGRIPWSMGRVGRGGRGAYVMTPELARAVRSESEAAVCHWWGVCTATVGLWRRRLGVGQFNGGTRHLWSLWKASELPKRVRGSGAVSGRGRSPWGNGAAIAPRAGVWAKAEGCDML